jgi:transposase
MVSAGLSCSETARHIDVAISTVIKAVRRFIARGEDGLNDGRRLNGQPKVDAAFRDRLVTILQRTPQEFGWQRPTWTRELLASR